MKISRLVVFVFCIVCVTYSLGQEVGNATFYHSKMQGRRMSNGEKYHRDSMFCAHKTFPLNSFLKVINPKNHKEVTVKVTDRGPFSKRLSIDLSYSAAKKLDIIRSGIAKVEIYPHKPINIPFKKNLILIPTLKLPQSQAPVIISTLKIHSGLSKEYPGI